MRLGVLISSVEHHLMLIQILKSQSVIHFTEIRHLISFMGNLRYVNRKVNEGLNVTYGHSKDNHPELKQVMTGMLTDEYGIPIYEQTLDGNTSDSTWIKSAIHYLQGLLGDKSGDYTFISVEYPASLLRGWKTSPRTINNNTIYQFRFRFVNFCSDLIRAKVNKTKTELVNSII